MSKKPQEKTYGVWAVTLCHSLVASGYAPDSAMGLVDEIWSMYGHNVEMTETLLRDSMDFIHERLYP